MIRRRNHIEKLARNMLIRLIAKIDGRTYQEVQIMMGHLPTKSIEKMVFAMKGVVRE